MKIVFFILAFFISTVAVWADEPKYNLQDRTDIYQFSQAGQVLGEVRVEAVFVLEPLIAPWKITVKIKCINNPKSKDLIVDSIKAYDYGTAKQADLLSTFNVDERKLTLYYRLGMVDEDRRVDFAEDGDQNNTYDLSSYCKVDL